jgi:hypothetical protein
MFQVHALDAEPFREFFSLDENELAARHAVLKTADAKPGYPCRVSLEDAEVGERVVLLNFEHQHANSPFRASHAIYVREFAHRAKIEPCVIPEALQLRLLSLRAFDEIGFIIDADVTDGRQAARMIGNMLENDAVQEIHLHNAKLGCYLARVTRA